MDVQIEAVMISDTFRADKQGRRFADMLVIPGFDFTLQFFDDSNRQRRMMESEVHHDRPALAGVVRELERDENIRSFYAKLPTKKAIRFRQAMGFVVRLVMQNHLWIPTGKRGSLVGLSKWFNRSERYINLFDD